MRQRHTLVLSLLIAPAVLFAQGGPAAPRAGAKASAKTAASPAASPARPRSAFGEFAGGLRARMIGPGVTGGRIVSIAVHPNDPGTIYLGVASGGVWKTVNGGASWQPIFDREGSYSIGTLTLDPRKPSTVWVGTGEPNAQRSVAYGDGVYRSDDSGRTWKNVGLKTSEHIGKILVHPTNSDVVYVAAQGPLWSAGGERGLYKTTDGGKTWEQVLKISENTGVGDAVMDPRDPDTIVAASWQRRRHFFTLIDGGPESTIHRTTDGGKTWTKGTGLPSEEMGRIGLAVSTAHNGVGVMYANVEAANRRGGIYRSRDGGVSWERRADYNQGSMYWGDIVADPVDADRIYIPDVVMQVSDDGGRTFRALGQRSIHVDSHSMWIDPSNTQHMLQGNDGGLYRTWDGGATWVFFANLPITQFYDVDVDPSSPFYLVCGGTQDNNSLCGPSRTKTDHGILNEDWFVTLGGDGFVSRVDPEDPNTIYSELQHAVIVRYDKRTGERVGIQPQEEKGDPPLRWNWDGPFIISPHASKRLYIGSQFLHRSDDRGNTWRKVSGDLTRQVDRNKLPVMGKVWGPDAVAKNTSTALYSNLSAVAESPRKEGLLYTGSDDGLVQVSEDGGANWRKIDALPGVPKDAYIARIRASQHDAGTAYVAVENHQNGDFKPYLVKTTDMGKTWTAITGDLPDRGSIYAVAEDHVDPNLLFVGTEFGAYFTKDGGATWAKIAGLPTIAVREIAIQKRENDLVLATFGRGFYVVDDYAPLRAVTSETLARPATMFPVKDALLFVPRQTYGGRGNASQGEALFSAPNPPYGAVFTYYLKDGVKSLRTQRTDAERAAERGNRAIDYPSFDALRAEAEEEAPTVFLTISDAAGNAIRTITGPGGKGLQRAAWDLRLPLHTLPAPRPAGGDDDDDFFGGQAGPYVTPGRYSATLSQRVGGAVTQLAGPIRFVVSLDATGGLTMADHQKRGEFIARHQALRRTVAGTLALANATSQRLDQLKRALDVTPAAPGPLHARVREYQKGLNAILIALRGDQAIASRSEGTVASISSRANSVSFEMNRTLGPQTTTHEQQHALAKELLAPQLAALTKLVDTDLPAFEKDVEASGAPWTAGRVPVLR